VITPPPTEGLPIPTPSVTSSAPTPEQGADSPAPQQEADVPNPQHPVPPQQQVQPQQPAAPQQPPKPQNESVRPPVSPARPRRRHRLVLLSLIVGVLLPMVASAGYLWEYAADQYVSKVGFTVRREDTSSAVEVLGGLANLSGTSSSDTDILYEFIQSQKLVSDMNAALNLRAMWSSPEEDVVFALTEGASIEELVNYWNKMVRPAYGAAGLLEVEVRAFSAEDATAIAEELFRKSTEMINNLSAIAREDAIRYARDDLDEALDRLKTAREAVTRFRNENQLVNPQLDLQSQAGLLATLQTQQAEAIIELDLLRDTVRTGDPRLEQAERKLEVIISRIAAERSKLGMGGGSSEGRAFADIVGEYERLEVEREFAERAYVTALATYDGALAESRRQSRYLAAYMQPTKAETPEYPHRITLLFLIGLFLFLSWSIIILIIYSVRDRR
jgi:capsular polysaccharide transport system permease protein